MSRGLLARRGAALERGDGEVRVNAQSVCVGPPVPGGHPTASENPPLRAVGMGARAKCLLVWVLYQLGI